MDIDKKILQLLEQKKQQITTKEDEDKILIIESLLENDNSFYDIKLETAIGILQFLNVPDEEVEDVYLELISPTRYNNKVPKERISITKN